MIITGEQCRPNQIILGNDLGAKPPAYLKFQGHITRSEIPARLPLPRLYDIATSLMQGTADVRL